MPVKWPKSIGEILKLLTVNVTFGYQCFSSIPYNQIEMKGRKGTYHCEHNRLHNRMIYKLAFLAQPVTRAQVNLRFGVYSTQDVSFHEAWNDEQDGGKMFALKLSGVAKTGIIVIGLTSEVNV